MKGRLFVVLTAVIVPALLGFQPPARADLGITPYNITTLALPEDESEYGWDDIVYFEAVETRAGIDSQEGLAGEQFIVIWTMKLDLEVAGGDNIDKDIAGGSPRLNGYGSWRHDAHDDWLLARLHGSRFGFAPGFYFVTARCELRSTHVRTGREYNPVPQSVTHVFIVN